MKIQPKGDKILKRQLGTLFLVTCLILTTVPAALSAPGASEVYIVGDWSGDFNDGEDDYAQINQTLKTEEMETGNSTLTNNQTTTYETAVIENILEQEVEAEVSHAGEIPVTDEGQTIDNNTLLTDSAEQEAKNATIVNDQINANEVSLNNVSLNDTTVMEPAPEQVFETGNEADSIIDNRLKEAAPNTVYKEKSYLDIGNRPGIGKYRELLLFDLSEYSYAENISSATLSLHWFYPDGKERPKDTVMEVYRPAAAWNPENVTWNSRDKDVLWTQPGGDWYDKNGVLQGNSPYATITFKGNTLPDNRYYELDVTELVKEYVRGKHENTGFLIKTRTESADYVAFYSSDTESEEQHPKLNVEQA